jgi:hypothetical protein
VTHHVRYWVLADRCWRYNRQPEGGTMIRAALILGFVGGVVVSAQSAS